MTTRVLIVKLTALGDAVMASTLVRAVRQRWPDARIGWLAGRGIAPFVRLIDGVDEVIEVNEKALFRGGRLPALATLLGAWRAVGRRWDVALVAHTDRRYALLSALSGARTKVRFAHALAPVRGEWYGTQYTRLVHDVRSPAGGVALPCIRKELLPNSPVRHGDRPMVIVAPGGARNLLRDDVLRRWPIADWVAATRLLVTSGFDVIAIGGHDDASECARCAEAGALNYSGRTTIPELMALMQSADVVVTHDSGPMHLAICMQRPVVALFGPTSPAEFLPPGANVKVLSHAQGLACAPCYDGNGFAPCGLNLCLTRVSANEVVQGVNEQLADVHSTRAQSST